MPIPFRDFLTFPFNSGRGIRTSQIEGEFIKSVTVESDTLVVVKQMSDGSEEVIRAEGVTAVPAFLRRMTASADKVFTEAEFLAATATTSMHEIINTPDLTGLMYLGFWLPADEGEITFIAQANIPTVNRRRTWFDSPVALTVGTQAGYYYPSKIQFLVDALNESGWVLRSDDGQPVYLRYCAIHQRPHDTLDADFTAADFAAAGNFTTSTSGEITAPAYVDGAWVAFAVPASTPDFTEIYVGVPPVGFNSIGVYMKQASPIQIGGISYNVWRTLTQRLDILSLQPYTLVQ